MPAKGEKLLQFLLLSAAKGFQPVVWQPPADVYRTAHGWMIKFELAGVRPEEIKLTVSGQSLTLRGVRRDICMEEGQHSYSMEISYNEFERTIDFPCDLERVDVATDYRDGMLLVRLTTRPTADEFC
jgi:HSP20 family protein